MKKRATVVFALIILFVSLLACGEVHSISNPTLEAMSSGFPRTASWTPSLTTATETPSSTPPIVSELPVVQQCINVGTTEYSLANLTTGTVVLNHDLSAFQYYLYEIQTGTEYSLPIQMEGFLFSLSVSPDRDKLAYTQFLNYVDGTGYTKMVLYVVNAKAEVLAKITYDRGDLDHLHWLGNDRLLFYNYLTTHEGVLLLLNPFRNEQRLLRNEMPDYFTDPYEEWRNWKVEYSPDLEWGMYVAAFDELKVVLRDYVSGETLWTSREFMGRAPRWSPDGALVAYADGNDLYLFNRSGEVTLLISDNRPGEDPMYIQRIHDYQWSPDGNYLAFWAANSLLLYDRQANLILNRCNLDDFSYHYLTWSPDGHQIDILSSKVDHSWTTREVIVDITNSTGFLINQDQLKELTIWMNSAP